MKKSLYLIWFVCAIVCSPTAHADDRVMQFVIDPLNPDRAWMLSENNLQYNSSLKADGKWKVRFDRSTFVRLTGIQPGPGYKHKKMQASKTKVGHLYLLIENTDARGGDKKMYIFATTDYGESWKFTVMGKKTTSAPPKVARKKIDDAGTVDLDALGAEPEATVSKKGGGGHSMAAATNGPIFKILFDLILDFRPHISQLSFDNYHSFVLADVFPRPELHFMFDVNPAPRFYELDYQATPSLTIRGGKIFIPFDEMDPHNSFGGRFNTSLVAQPGGAAFLPDIWADYGLGLRIQLADSKELSAVADLYVTNGFGYGGTDPLGHSSYYPSFSTPTSVPPNSNDSNTTEKAFGMRLHANIMGTLGVGVSAYTNRYTPDFTDTGRILMLGLDSQLRFATGTDFSMGYVYTSVGLVGVTPGSGEPTSFLRGGLYVNASQKLSDRWKLTLAFGMTQNDNRVSQPTDEELLGFRLEYNIMLMKFFLEYYHDLDNPNGATPYFGPGKANFDYYALRAVVMF